MRLFRRSKTFNIPMYGVGELMFVDVPADEIISVLAWRIHALEQAVADLQRGNVDDDDSRCGFPMAMRRL